MTDDLAMKAAWREYMGELPMEGMRFALWRNGWDAARVHYEKPKREFPDGTRVMTAEKLGDYDAPGIRLPNRDGVVDRFHPFHEPVPYQVYYDHGGSGFFAAYELTRRV